MLTRGTLRRCVPPDTDVPIVLRVSGGVSILRELSHEGLTVAVEDAIRLNAAAMTLSVFVGAEGERTTLLNLSKLIDAGERYGIPVLAVTAVGKEMARDARYLGLACRICAEQGAHVVKTYYCEGFEQVVRGTPVPLVIAGGKKIPEREAIALAHAAVAAGAAGVDMGRNIFQSDCPVGMIRAVRAVVHDGASADEAWEIYRAELARVVHGAPG
jgi:putative autoinducer-2 (AI-2) aldolase